MSSGFSSIVKMAGGVDSPLPTRRETRIGQGGKVGPRQGFPKFEHFGAKVKYKSIDLIMYPLVN
jgi:hypothetical protein